jgi:hypothetical protein
MLYAIADKPHAVHFHRYGYLSLAARVRAASSIVTTLGPSPVFRVLTLDEEYVTGTFRPC